MSSFRTFISSEKGLYGILFCFGFLIYVNTWNHDYALDDSIVIVDNVFTSKGLSGIKDLFTADTFYGFFNQSGKDNLVQGGRYRPLSLATFALEVELFGMKPGISHWINSLLYALLGLLVFRVLNRLFKDQRQGVIIAFWSTLLFVVHPLHTEVVANIKGRDEILALGFALLALDSAIKYLDLGKRSELFFGALFVFLGAMSKENALTFLGVIPLAIWLFRTKKLQGIIYGTLPVCIGVLVFLVIRFSILGSGISEVSMELMNNPFLKWTGSTYIPMTWSEKAPIILHTMYEYLRLEVLPINLTHDYYPRYIDIKSWTDWTVIASILLHLGLLVVAWIYRKRQPIWTFGIVFYFLTLSIVSNVFVSIGTNMAERFVFMPSLGASVLVVSVIVHILGKKASGDQVHVWSKNWYPLMAGVLIFAFLTIQRNPVWADNYTLFTTDIQKSTQSAKLCNSAAGIIIDTHKDGVESVKFQELNKAKSYAEQAIAIHPTFRNPYLLRGNAAYYLKEFDDAIIWYEQALSFAPEYEDAKNNLFEAYLKGGEYAGQSQQDLPKAILMFQKAMQMPQGAKSYELNRLMGVAYGISGQSDKAVEYFGNCVQLEPENPWAYYNLLTGYANMNGQTDMVQSLEQKILALDSEFFINLRNN